MLSTRLPLGGLLRACSKILLAVLVAPWLVGAVVWRLARALAHVARSALLLRYLAVTHVRCPRGHQSALHGVFECRSCGALFAGWAFQQCPVCQTTCGHIACEHCGLSVRNPLLS